jgi:hypothetical protein
LASDRPCEEWDFDDTGRVFDRVEQENDALEGMAGAADGTVLRREFNDILVMLARDPKDPAIGATLAKDDGIERWIADFDDATLMYVIDETACLVRLAQVTFLRHFHPMG